MAMLQVVSPVEQTSTPALSLPNWLLRLEGLALFIATLFAYAQLGGNWVMFIVLLFVPDVGMLGYALNPKLGAQVYNLAHFILLPLVLLALAWAGGWTLGVQIALIWAAHINMDRVVGYGFKYASGFKDTHMQKV